MSTRINELIERFVDIRPGGGSIPDNLGALLQAFGREPAFAGSDRDPLRIAGAELLWPDQSHPLLDHDYLTERDRADPAIMANVNAMIETAKDLRFALQAEDTSLLGYWQRDPDIPGSGTLVWLDTEGQYDVAEGATLAETLAYRPLLLGDSDTYEAVLRAFEELGIQIERRSDKEIFAAMGRRRAALSETPQDYRDRLYREFRGQ